MARAKRKPSRKRQQEILGAERPTIDELDEVVQPYVETLYKRIELQQREPELKAQVAECMKQHQLEQYTYEDGDEKFHFTLLAKENLKCKRETSVEE